VKRQIPKAQGQIRLVVASGADRFDRHVARQESGKSGRVMHAMLQMKKIDIKRLKDAYER
jgi:hypothetical protein